MIDQHLKLFVSLNDHGVEYLLIGGALAIAYGVPRVTKDIDLFLKPTRENAARCLEALQKCGMGTASLTTAEDLCDTEITIFKDILRVDVLTMVKGLDFAAAWANKVFLELDTVLIPSISLEDLIKAKKATARPDDLEDIKILELARQKK